MDMERERLENERQIEERRIELERERMEKDKKLQESMFASMVEDRKASRELQIATMNMLASMTKFMSEKETDKESK